MSKLKRGKAKPKDYPMLGRENVPGKLDDIEIDGVLYPLDQQPPAAKSNGWGDMSWTRPRR